MSDEIFSKKGLKKAIRESQEILNLVPRMYIKPGEAFSKIIEIAKFQKLCNFLVIYYICYSPLLFLLGVSLIFMKGESGLLTVIFYIPFLLIAAVASCGLIGGYALIISYISSGIYYFLGKFFKAKGKINDVLSAMVLFVASVGLITVPEGFMLWGYKELYVEGSTEVLTMTIIYILTIIFLSIIYLPPALSKSLRINLPRAFILTILPYLILLIGAVIGTTLI